MSKQTIIAIVVVLILLVGGYFLFTHSAAAPTPDQDQDADTSVPAETTGSAATNATGVTQTVTTTTTVSSPIVVTYTDSGFSPKSVSLKVGQAVTFVNNSTHGMWVASDVHPTHAAYDGTNAAQHCSAGHDNNGGFDECSAVNTGSSYTFTFAKAGTFQYHNHVRANDTGTVVVSQ